MALTMAIWTNCHCVLDHVPSSLSKRINMMHFKIRSSSGLEEWSGSQTAFTNTARPIHYECCNLGTPRNSLTRGVSPTWNLVSLGLSLIRNLQQLGNTRLEFGLILRRRILPIFWNDLEAAIFQNSEAFRFKATRETLRSMGSSRTAIVARPQMALGGNRSPPWRMLNLVES